MKGKKLLLSLAAFGLLAGLVGCNNGAKSEESKKSESSQQPASSVEPASSSEEPASSIEPASSSEEPTSSQAPTVQSKIKVEGAGGVKKITGIGKTLQLSASADNEALSGVTWESKNTAVATVDSNGLVTSVAKGSAQITANKEGYKEGVIAITVELEKIEISSEGDVKKITGLNQTLQLSAKLNGEPLIGVTWASKNADIASVSNTGLVTSVGKGSTSITASLEPYAEATFAISVELVKINVSAANDKTQLLLNETVQLSADQQGVEWKTSNAEMATVSNEGLVTANNNKNYGTVTISAEKAGFDAGSVEISVVRPEPTAVLHMEDADHYSSDGMWGTTYGSTVYGPGEESPVYARTSGNASDETCIAYMDNGDQETLTFSSSAAVRAELLLTMASRSAVSDMSTVMEVRFNNVAIDLSGKEFAGGSDTNTFLEFSLGEVDLVAGDNVLKFDFLASSPYMDDLKVYADGATQIAVVQPVEKQPVTVNQESITVVEGKTSAITSTMEGLSYKSNSTAIATVDENGVVSGVKAGETTISISKDGFKTIKLPVTVTEAEGVFVVQVEDGTSEGNVITFKTSNNLDTLMVDTWPTDAVLTLNISDATAGTYVLYMNARAHGGYSGGNTDDLATCMEVKVNGGAALSMSGSVTSGAFKLYELGEITLNAGANVLTIKSLTDIPTIDLFRFVPKA